MHPYEYEKDTKMQRVSKNGKTYNVPTVKSTYLSKSEKKVLAALVASELARRNENPPKTAEDYATMSALFSLGAKLETTEE